VIEDMNIAQREHDLEEFRSAEGLTLEGWLAQ
jgi:hypothetical protein